MMFLKLSVLQVSAIVSLNGSEIYPEVSAAGTEVVCNLGSLLLQQMKIAAIKGNNIFMRVG